MAEERSDDHWDRVIVLPEEMAGVWANMVRITPSPYEFTLDFARVDYASPEGDSIMVSRVAMSPFLFSELVEIIDQIWKSYAEQAFPREVEDGGAG